MNNLVFIGFRGTGKTTLATELAQRLQYPILSTDVLIEQHAEKSIRDYVQLHGWTAFRTLELAILQSLAGTQRTIIDCGGGVVEQSEGMLTLSSLGTVIWVDAELEDIYRRLINDRSRPLLSTDDLWSDLATNYARRRPLYEQYGQVYVNTSQNTIDESIEHILNGTQTGRV
jgi:shikimate kinase